MRGLYLASEGEISSTINEFCITQWRPWWWLLRVRYNHWVFLSLESLSIEGSQFTIIIWKKLLHTYCLRTYFDHHIMFENSVHSFEIVCKYLKKANRLAMCCYGGLYKNYQSTHKLLLLFCSGSAPCLRTSSWQKYRQPNSNVVDSLWHAWPYPVSYLFFSCKGFLDESVRR